MLPAGSPIELEVGVNEMAAVLEGVVVLTTAERIAVQCPLSRRSGVSLDVDETVRVHTVDGSVITSFESVVVSVTREPGLVVVAIAPPDQVAEERREFYRLDYTVRVDLAVPGAKRVSAESVDFGGGGIAVFSPVPLDKGTDVGLCLHLDDDGGALDTRGTVVRVHEVPDRPAPTFRLGIAFDQADAQGQRRLIQFVFAKQRELRRKGML